MGRGIISPFVDIYPYITARFPTSHPAPQFDARTAKTRRTDIQRYHPNPKSETLSALSRARKRPQNRPPPAFARPSKACPPPTAKPHRLSATGKRFRLMTRVQPRKPPTSATLRIGHDRSAKSVNRNPANVTFYLLFRLGKHRHCNHRKRTRISDNPLKFARNMCSLSDCPQFNRFKLQHTTQNTPSPDARAHSTATAAPATRLNSSTHREHPASSHPNTAFASNQSHLRTNPKCNALLAA